LLQFIKFAEKGSIKMKTIQLPFGLNENKVLVHVTEVEKGKNCNCVCPDCRSPLVASKGNINQHHFKHAVNNNCEGGFESAIHLAAKQVIKVKKQITVSKYVSIASAIDSEGVEHTNKKTIIEDKTIIRFDSVQEEVELHGMRTDILAKKGNTPLIIEIFYRHKVEDQKRKKIADANISAIEINLSDLTPKDVKDWKALELYINDPKRVEWLYNAKDRIYYPALEKQLIEIIREQEKKYIQEELEKQRKEKKEKTQLLHALDELKILSSQESIAQFKQEAEMHPFWKNNSRYLPFSLNKLPDFINVDVPDGDWIFGCDRRIWQAAFYKTFIIWNKSCSISVDYVDEWLQNKVGCKVPLSVKTVGMYSKRYRQLIPADIYDNRPSTWKTLFRYFKYLEDLGMLEFSRDFLSDRRSKWFKVISKIPKIKTV
jgi:hypothetical protein